MSRRGAAAALVLATILWRAATAVAHDEKVSASDVLVGAGEIVWKVDVGLLGLEKVVKLPAAPAALTESQLQTVRHEIAGYLLRNLDLEIDGKRAEPTIGTLEPIYEAFLVSGEPYIARVRQEFVFPSAGKPARLRLDVRFFSDLTREHRALVHVRWEDRQRDFVRVGPSAIELSYERLLNPTLWTVSRDFLLWGAHHIFIGYDHIAFLMAVLLGSRRLRETILVITSFTLAHSLTLFLAAVDVIRLPTALTEALIAASIVYVSLENYFQSRAGRRWIVTFGFGLVHGLGFSSALKERLMDASAIVVPVISFNLGVELGQILILAAAYPILVWLSTAADEAAAARRRKRLVWVGSSAVLLLGLGWLIERVFGVEFMPF